MFTRLVQITLITIGISGTGVALADFDGSEPLMCSFGHVIECDAGVPCRPVTNESIDAPHFVKIDFRKKELVSTTAGQDSSPDDITYLDLANYLVVQGVQGGAQGSADSLGWSMTINHDTGQMVSAGAGENAGFVIFGACTPI